MSPPGRERVGSRIADGTAATASAAMGVTIFRGGVALLVKDFRLIAGKNGGAPSSLRRPVP